MGACAACVQSSEDGDGGDGVERENKNNLKRAHPAERATDERPLARTSNYHYKVIRRAPQRTSHTCRHTAIGSAGLENLIYEYVNVPVHICVYTYIFRHMYARSGRAPNRHGRSSHAVTRAASSVRDGIGFGILFFRVYVLPFHLAYALNRIGALGLVHTHDASVRAVAVALRWPSESAAIFIPIRVRVMPAHTHTVYLIADECVCVCVRRHRQQ